MTQEHTIEQLEQSNSLAESPAKEVGTTGFGAEFRELARQRRFVRSAESKASSWRDIAAPRGETHSSAKPLPPLTASDTTKSLPRSDDRAISAANRTLPKKLADQRITDDQQATLRELARMSDRLVDSREQLAAANVQVQNLSRELDTANKSIQANEQRVIASRVLVQDAQMAAHAMAERSAWLEARCDTLQEALELAVNASWLTRLRWRREHRASLIRADDSSNN